jgi:hypothetical protein
VCGSPWILDILSALKHVSREVILVHIDGVKLKKKDSKLKKNWTEIEVFPLKITNQ